MREELLLPGLLQGLREMAFVKEGGIVPRSQESVNGLNQKLHTEEGGGVSSYPLAGC